MVHDSSVSIGRVMDAHRQGKGVFATPWKTEKVEFIWWHASATPLCKLVTPHKIDYGVNNVSEMLINTLFSHRKTQNFSGEWAQPLPRPHPYWGEENPSADTTPFGAYSTSIRCLQRSLDAGVSAPMCPPYKKILLAPMGRVLD